jgi:DNA-binding MarR family transcriptional regulator
MAAAIPSSSFILIVTMPHQQTLFQVFNEIGIIAQLSQNGFERVMPMGMTLAQFTVLNHFVRLGDGKSPVDLARAFQVTKPTMSSTLSRLADKGFILIRNDEKDGRAKRVFITQSGRDMREACITALEPELEKLIPALDIPAMAEFLKHLSHLRSVLDNQRDAV